MKLLIAALVLVGSNVFATSVFSDANSCGAWAYNGWTDSEGGFTSGCARPQGGTEYTTGTVLNPLTNEYTCPDTCHYCAVQTPQDWGNIEPDANGNCFVECCAN